MTGLAFVNSLHAPENPPGTGRFMQRFGAIQLALGTNASGLVSNLIAASSPKIRCSMGCFQEVPACTVQGAISVNMRADYAELGL
jgi:hypothetical protein